MHWLKRARMKVTVHVCSPTFGYFEIWERHGFSFGETDPDFRILAVLTVLQRCVAHHILAHLIPITAAYDFPWKLNGGGNGKTRVLLRSN